MNVECLDSYLFGLEKLFGFILVPENLWTLVYFINCFNPEKFQLHIFIQN